MYHLRCVKELALKDNPRSSRDYEQVEHIVILSTEDYRKFLKHKQVVGFIEETILHDPTLQQVVADEPEAEADRPNETVVRGRPPKKG